MIVFVAPETEKHNEILNTLTSWSALSLVRPFAWWALGAGESASPPRQVTVVRAGRTMSTRLANALVGGQGDHDLIVVELIDGSESEPSTWLEEARLAKQAFADLLSGDQISETLHVMVPTRRDTGLLQSHLAHGWDHVVLVPDNRESPSGSIDFLADHPEIVPLHAAHGLSALAGVLIGSSPTDAPIDLSIERSLRELPSGAVLGVRVFSHVVDLGRLLDELAAGLTVSSQEPPLPTSGFVRFRPDDNALDALANAYVSSHRDVFGPSIVTVDVETRVRGLWPYLKLMFTVLKRVVLSKPAEWAAIILQRLYDGIAERLEGVGEAITGRKVDRWFDTDVGSNSNAQPIAGISGPEDDGAVAPAWRNLVALVIGLVDGGLLPPDVLACLIEPEALEGRVVAASFLVADRHADAAADGIPTLLDRIGTLIEASRNEVVRQTAAQQATTDTLAEEVAKAQRRLDKHGKRSIVRGLIGSFVIASIVAAAGVWAMLRELNGPIRTVLLAASPLFWIAVFLSQVLRVIHRRLRRQRRHLTLRRQHRAAEQRLAELQNDEARLVRRQADLDDWNSILARFLRQPFGGSASIADGSARLSGVELPPSFRAAAAITEVDVRNRLIATCQRRVFAPSWLSQIFADLVEHTMADLVGERGDSPLDLGTSSYDPYADVSTRADSPRRFLLSRLTTGKISPLSRTAVDRDLIGELGNLLVGTTGGVGETATLMPHGGTGSLEDEVLDLMDGADHTFLGGALPELQSALRPSVVSIATRRSDGAYGGTGFVAASDGLIVTNKHVVEGAQTITVELASGVFCVATTIEVSDVTDLAALRIDVDQLCALRIAAHLPVVGQEVFSLGYPLLMDGEPTFSRGTITAVERMLPSMAAGEPPVRVVQADFRLAGGASGSPVVDSSGVVVGVHFASRVPAVDESDQSLAAAAEQWNFASFLVPADELSTFVAGVTARHAFSAVLDGPSDMAGRASVRVSEFLNVEWPEHSSLPGFGGVAGRPSASFRKLTTTSTPVGRQLGDVADLTFGAPVRLIQTTVHVASLDPASLQKPGPGS